MSLAVSMPYSSSTEMDYFGRYGPSVRTESMPVFGPALYGNKQRDERLEQIALHMEYYMNYRGSVADGRCRQPKLGAVPKSHSDNPSLRKRQPKQPLANKRSVSVPSFPNSSILKSPSSSKCSSPKGKKSVRFADTQGLPLTTVHQKSAADMDDASTCPVQSELMRLSLQDEGRALKQPPRPESPPSISSPTRQELEYHFNQPGIEPNFMKRVMDQKVCLENLRRDGGNIHGVVRVRNIDFHKYVTVRWTSDKWQTVHSQPAVYCAGSSDAVSDRFSFQLPITGSSIEFAVCFRAAGQEFWDNNREHNYLISVRSLQ